MSKLFTRDVAYCWVKDLRSGKYKQGTGLLHNHRSGARCCLGVLLVQFTGKDDSWATLEFAADDLAKELNELQKPADSSASSVTRHFMDLNDKVKLPFEAIADYIEAEVLPQVPD